MKKETSVQSPQRLEEAMQVISVKSWIAAASILTLLGAAFVWAFFGTMRLEEPVTGVLVRSGKVINIYSSEGSTILDLSVKTGQYVEQNQVIARFDQLELVSDINMMIEGGDASEAEIDVARKELLERSRVLTYNAGRVLDVYVRVGDYVSKGTKIASISVGAERNKALECLLFVPFQQVRNIRKGMEVNVYPDFADKNEYGNMRGTVAFISEYPVTKQYLFDVLGNESLADTFSGHSACYEVSVNLVTSSETVTGYEWTTSSGPQKEIGSLSICDATVITSELRPIDVFFLNK